MYIIYKNSVHTSQRTQVCLHHKDQSLNVVYEKPMLTVRISRNTWIHYMDIIVTRLEAAWTGARNQVGKEIWLFSKTPRLALESPPSLIRLVPGNVEGPVCDANHSPPSTAKIKILSAFMTYIMATLSSSGQNVKSVVENKAVHTVTTISSSIKNIALNTGTDLQTILFIWVVRSIV